MIWPKEISPYHVYLLSLGRNEEISKKAEVLYNKLVDSGIEALWDDRDKKAGAKFKDADLLGVPIRLIIGKKSYRENCVEWKQRGREEVSMIPEDEVVEKIKEFYRGVI